jgi:DNA repair protein RecO (recombination protein O)
MIEKDQAIVLRTAPYSNTSRFVLWLTRAHGRIATLIKGALRPKSAFIGQFDLFYTCELLYYIRDRAGLHIARECTPLKPRAPLREKWRACLGASYLADLCARALPDAAAAPPIFDWLDAALDELAEGETPLETILRAELAFLDLLGLRPVLDRCAVCGNPAGRTSFFAAAGGGRLCGRCAPRARNAHPAPPDALAILAGWQFAQSPREARAIRCSTRQARDIEALLGAFLCHHLELDPVSRRLAYAGIADGASAHRGRAPSFRMRSGLGLARVCFFFIFAAQRRILVG